MTYLSHTLSHKGETFIFPDGTRRFIHHRYFVQAKLMNDETLLKLYYSFCRVEIAGENLNYILTDLVTDRMGTIFIDPEDYGNSPKRVVITSIVYIADAPEEEAESQSEVNHAPKS